jgi:ribokinase
MAYAGKGANQAVACAKLGPKGEQGQVSIITKVGTDVFGTNTIDNFRSVGLDTSCVRKYFHACPIHSPSFAITLTHVLSFPHRTSEASTGVAPIYVDDEGHNSIVIVTGTTPHSQCVSVASRCPNSLSIIVRLVPTGANDLLTEDEVKESTSAIASSAVLAAQLEIDPQISLAALKIAREHGVSTLHTCTAHALTRLTHSLRPR